MSECVFCAIVRDAEPSRKIAQSQHFVAILDISPLAPGDTIILSKEHYKDLLDFPEEYGGELFAFIKRVANTMMAVTKSDSFNLVVNNGESAGQQVFHTHMHIIPRRRNDGLQMVLGSHRLITNMEMDAQLKQLQDSYRL